VQQHPCCWRWQKTLSILQLNTEGLTASKIAVIQQLVYSSGSQTFLKKLRNGPLAIFLMAHSPLKKSTQINMKQHFGFLLYQCDRCTCFCAISSAMFGSILARKLYFAYNFFLQEHRVDFFVRFSAVPTKLSRGPQKDCRPQFENHWSTRTRHSSLLSFRGNPLSHCTAADKLEASDSHRLTNWVTPEQEPRPCHICPRAVVIDTDRTISRAIREWVVVHDTVSCRI